MTEGHTTINTSPVVGDSITMESDGKCVVSYCKSVVTILCRRCHTSNYCFDHMSGQGYTRIFCPKCHSLQCSDVKYLVVIDNDVKKSYLFTEREVAEKFMSNAKETTGKDCFIEEMPVTDHDHRVTWLPEDEDEKQGEENESENQETFDRDGETPDPKRPKN